MKLEELLEKEAVLEKRRLEYIEADDNRMAKKTEKELDKVRDLIDVKRLEQKTNIVKELKLYKRFIKLIGNEKVFEDFKKEEKKRERNGNYE